MDMDMLSWRRSVYHGTLSTSLSPRLSLANHAVHVPYHPRATLVATVFYQLSRHVLTVDTTPCPPGIQPSNPTTLACESELVCLDTTITESKTVTTDPALPTR